MVRVFTKQSMRKTHYLKFISFDKSHYLQISVAEENGDTFVSIGKSKEDYIYDEIENDSFVSSIQWNLSSTFHCIKGYFLNLKYICLD